MWPYISPYKGRALLALLVTIPAGMLDAVIAWSIKPYMDVVLIEKSIQHTVYIPFFIIFISSLQSGFNYAATYLNAWVGIKITNDVKSKLFSKLMQNDTAYFDQSQSGKILFQYNNDVDTACRGLISNLKLFTTRIFSSLSLIGVLFYNSWQLAIVAVLVLVCALSPLSAVRRRLKSMMESNIATGSNILTHYNEAYSGNRIITSYGIKNYIQSKFDDTLKAIFKLNIKMIQKTGIMSPAMHFVVSIGIGAVIWLGSSLIVTNEITPGNFVSFLTALIMLYTPIKGIGNNFNSVQMSLLALERVQDLLNYETEIRDSIQTTELTDIIDKITFNNVHFGYNPKKEILFGINLEIKVGKTVALVGNSGGGKSTLAHLLPRFYDVKSGSIQIDGVDIREFSLTSLRSKISFVFQDNFLFSGTIRDNIILGNNAVSQSDLEKAIKDSCLEEWTSSLENGLDTEIGERGVLISGGQKQRIAIARALLKNAPIVILDEATSALDNKSEAIVQKAIENLMKNKTVIIIAHRLSTIRHADNIFVVNNGHIIESGTHDELLNNQQSTYSMLYSTQLHH